MACVVSPIKLTHPALFTTGLATPPLTPTSPIAAATPTRSSSLTTLQPPVPSYAMIRAAHVHAVRYVITKLRWEQKNNLYLPHQDAEWNHDQLIVELEKELDGVQNARERLDRFPNSHAPVAYPAPHGPRTREQEEELVKLEKEKAALLNAKLEKQFPWIKQLFVGPMTKQQYRHDKLLRQRLQIGEFDDLSLLLPSINKRALSAMMHDQEQKKAGGGGAAPRESYEQRRLEKEKAKIAAQLEQKNIAAGAPLPASGARAQQARIGPLTKDEYLASLPRFGPMTKNESMLPKQREHRHEILDWFRRPWAKFDPDAAVLMEQLAQLAKKRTEEAKKARDDKVKEDKASKVEQAGEAAKVKQAEAQK